jgi:putative redox protein
MAGSQTTVSLAWTGALTFTGEAHGGRQVTTDGDSHTALSPVELLAVSVASCMAMDVVHVLTKSRLPLAGLRVAFTGDRAETHPRRFVRIGLAFEIDGAVPEAQLDRALQLSKEKYCSVWNTLQQDIPLEITTHIRALDPNAQPRGAG